MPRSLWRGCSRRRPSWRPIVNAYAAQHVEELVQGVGVHLGRAQLAELNRAAE